MARRPLTLDEIDLAIGVNEHTFSYADLDTDGSPRLQKTLPSRCGLMVAIIESRVYLIHQTAKDFLLGEVGTSPSTGTIWQQSLDLEESRQLVAEICLRSLSFSEVQLDQVNLYNALLPEGARETQPNAYCQANVFLSYSAIYWAEHFREQTTSKGIKVVEQFLETSDCHSVVGRDGDDYGTKLHAASLGGHERIVQMLLDKGVDVNAQGVDYGYALQAASVHGYDQVVRMLLDKGADVNAQGGEHGHALQAASAGGHEQVVMMLLNKGVDVNAPGRWHMDIEHHEWENAIQAALARNHRRIVLMLLLHGAHQEVVREGRVCRLVPIVISEDDSSTEGTVRLGWWVQAEQAHENLVDLGGEPSGEGPPANQ